MRHILVTITFLFLFISFSRSQEVKDIKSSSDFLWGEATESNLQRADREAIQNLVSQISKTVESEFRAIFNTLGNEEFKKYLEELMNTYSTTVSIYSEGKVQDLGGQTYVFRYINKDDLDGLFVKRKNKILDYYFSARGAEKDLRIGDALKYYYWSLVLLRSHPDCNRISVKDEKGNDHLLITDLPSDITKLFSLVDMEIELDMQVNNERVISLRVTSGDLPVQNIDYTFWQGDTWSTISSVKDGIGAVSFSDAMTNNKNIRLRIEYMYTNECNFDPELLDVLAVSDLPYFEEAEIEIPLQEAETKNKPEKKLEAVDESKEYVEIIQHIYNFIEGKDKNSIRDYFTTDGYAVYEKLIGYGKAKVLPFDSELKAANYGNNTFVRAIPMLFSFDNNQRTFVEKVVFEFDSTKKITNIAFALSDKALNDIQSKSERFATNEEKALLISFMENYKTAYCLGRIDYLEQVFAEDALIIVGKVLEKKKDSGPDYGGTLSQDQVEFIRLSKNEYIERLKLVYKSNEFINIHFEDNTVKKARADSKIYGIQIKQNYYSANYGDVGYLFLMIDLAKIEEPKIYVRTWQPNKNPDGSIYGVADFDIQ